MRMKQGAADLPLHNNLIPNYYSDSSKDTYLWREIKRDFRRKTRD